MLGMFRTLVGVILVSLTAAEPRVDVFSLLATGSDYFIEDTCLHDRFHMIFMGNIVTHICPPGSCMPPYYNGDMGYKQGNPMTEHPCVYCSAATTFTGCVPLASGATSPGQNEPFYCEFALSDMCGMVNLDTKTDPFPYQWTLYQGSTLTANTGPSFDNSWTQNGYYLYCDSDDGDFTKPFDDSHFALPSDYSGSEPLYLAFDFHMWGSQERTLKVMIRDSNNQDQSVYQVSGDHGNYWRHAQVALPGAISGGYKVLFQCNKYQNDRYGDIAIDNVRLEIGLATPGKDCTTLQDAGNGVIGWYKLRVPDGAVAGREIDFYCNPDMGVTYIMRRFDGSLSFDQNWQAYKDGFGSPSGEFWIGLDLLNILTTSDPTVSYTLQITLKDYDGVEYYASYSSFAVGPENMNYPLALFGYDPASTAGDALWGFPEPNELSNAMPFSTSDNYNAPVSGINCASEYGSGWWFNKYCSSGNLNAYWATSATCDQGPFRCANWDPLGGAKTYQEINMVIIRN